MAPSLERLKKPVGELLMHMGETYRQTQEERELIDRALPTQHDGKVRTTFPSPCEEGVWTQGWLPVCTVGDKAIHCKALLSPQDLYKL